MGRQRTVEGSLVRDIIYQQNAHSASIVCCRDRSEAFLARRIPYLQLYSLSVEFDGSDLEVDADSSYEGGRE